MPKKRKIVTTEEEIPPDDQTTPPANPVDERIDDEVSSFFSAIGGDVTQVKIYRYAEGARLAYVATVAPDEVSEEVIAQVYGPGRYSIRLCDQSGKYVAHRRLDIDGNRALWEAQRQQAALGAVKPTENGGASAQLELLRDQINRQQEMMLKLVESRNGGSSSTSDTINLLTTLLDRFKPADPAGSIRTMMEAFTRGVEVAGTVGSEGDSKLAWLKVIERVAELVPKTIQDMNAARVGGGETLPQRNPIQTARMALASLKPKALKGADPGIYIDLLMDNLEDPAWMPALELLRRPYDEIVTAVGDQDLSQEPYRSWFNKLREGILDELQRLTAMDGTERHGSDTGGDGSPGA